MKDKQTVFIEQMEDELWHVYDSNSGFMIEPDFKSAESAEKWIKEQGLQQKK